MDRRLTEESFPQFVILLEDKLRETGFGRWSETLRSAFNFLSGTFESGIQRVASRERPTHCYSMPPPRYAWSPMSPTPPLGESMIPDLPPVVPPSAEDVADFAGDMDSLKERCKRAFKKKTGAARDDANRVKAYVLSTADRIKTNVKKLDMSEVRGDLEKIMAALDTVRTGEASDVDIDAAARFAATCVRRFRSWI